MSSFYDFLLQPSTQATLASMEITEPTPIQAAAIPALLAGKDVVGQSATGSGKTLAYAIPLVERVARDKRTVQALVLVPTRELAIQVHAVLGQLATSRRLTTAILVGGRPYGAQFSALRYGAQIVIGTPGRVKDHLDRGSLVLSQLRMCILDEADQMLDSGFAPAIEEILTTTPDNRQMALFSATMPDWVATLQEKFLNNPVKLDLTPAMGSESSIEQIAYQVPQEQKMAALCTLLHATEGETSLVFGKTKYGVEKLGKQLSKLGFTVGTLHGNKSQRAREEVLTAFRRGHVQTLLATNVAARGLDIHGIYQVINYELPESSDLFTHRIGRTGRMGRQGKAITLLVPSDVPKWRRMARNLGQVVALKRLVLDEQALATPPAASPEPAKISVQEREQREQYDNRRPVHDRQTFSLAAGRGGHVQTEQDRDTESGRKRPHKEHSHRDTPARTPEYFPSPERSSADRRRDARSETSKQSSFRKGSRKHEAHAFAPTGQQFSAARRKPRATPVASARRAPASNRFASRSRFSK